MKLQQILAIALLLSLMFNAGLQFDRAEFAAVLKRYGLLLRAVVANFIIVPLAAVLIVRALHVDDAVATGLLLMAIAAGVPFVILSGGAAKGGNHALAVTLALLLPVISYFTIPPMVKLLFPASEQILYPANLLFSLLKFQLAPLVLGAIVAVVLPAVSRKIAAPVGRLTLILLLTFFAVLTPSIWRSLLSVFGSLGMVAAVVIDIVSLLTGWLLGGPDTADRFTLAIGTALRNPGTAMFIASTAFADPTIAAGVTVYFLVQFIGASTFGGKGVQRLAVRLAGRL